MTRNVELVRRGYEAFERKDLDGVAAGFGDDCEIEFIGPESIPYAGSYHGPAGMKEALRKYLETCDVLESEVDELHEAGDVVTVLTHERCRAKATGREWRTRKAHVFTLRDGKIRRFLCLFDTAAVAEAHAGAGVTTGEGRRR
ncbi:MAG: nuclear transport factor 2 family protein [Planctomycetes bacterium]|nr:nuclear transport factor 2 family protein [Planctomycetota bacterium]